jgi:hypothetical protein
MSIETFPQFPDDSDTHTCWGVSFTYFAGQNEWRPADAPTGDDWDPLAYGREIIYGTQVVYYDQQTRLDNILWDQIRAERTRRIEAVEWRYNRYARETRLGATPTDDISALDTYVQALAGITKQEDPNNITWPTLE